MRTRDLSELRLEIASQKKIIYVIENQFIEFPTTKKYYLKIELLLKFCFKSTKKYLNNKCR